MRIREDFSRHIRKIDSCVLMIPFVELGRSGRRLPLLQSPAAHLQGKEASALHHGAEG